MTLVCTQLYSSSLYRLVGSGIRAIVAGSSVAVIMMLVTFTGSGFVLLRKQIRPWWIWMFWLSPLQYVVTGLANNEFLGDSYKDSGTLGPELAPRGIGKLFMDTFQFNQGNKWRCVLGHGTCTVAAQRYQTLWGNRFCEKGPMSPESWWVSELVKINECLGHSYRDLAPQGISKLFMDTF